MIKIDKWWLTRLRMYNLKLIYFGLLAVIIHNILINIIIAPYVSSSKTTLRSVILLIIMYILILVFENVFYFIGSLSEKIIKPSNIDKYRIRLFKIGSWVSWIILFLPSLSILIFPEFYKIDFD